MLNKERVWFYAHVDTPAKTDRLIEQRETLAW